LAVGDDANLSNYEVGTLLPTNCLTYTLVVGNDITYANGNVAGGMIAYGNTASLTSVTDECGTAVQTSNVLNFAPIMNGLVSVSSSIAQAPQQGSSQQYYSTLEISGVAQINYVTISSDLFSQVTAITVNIPADSWIFITVTGSDVKFAELDITLSATTNVSYVLWNFAQASELELYGISVKGSLLAPLAAIQFDNGNIDGSICGSSFNGTGELHLYPYVPPTTGCTCPICPKQILFPNYTFLVQTTVNLTNTDCQGRFAAGGDVQLYNYAIGTMLVTSSPPENILLVGGNLNFTNGEVHCGNAVIGGTATVVNVGIPNGELEPNTPPPIHFHADFVYLSEVSKYFSGLASTGSVGIDSNGDISMTATSTSSLNVFSISSSSLTTATAWQISGPEGAYVIVNVEGSNVSLDGIDMTVTGGIKNTTVILNFYDASAMTIEATSVQGTVLAVDANVYFTNGNVDGSMYCNSVYGDGEIHLALPLPINFNCPPCDC